MKRFLPLLSLLMLATLPYQALAWDDNWTQARSGDDALYDPDSSQGKSGLPESPLSFFTAPTPDFADVDPEEQNDYFGRGKRHDYVPYALARITQDLHYGTITLPKGYYLIKPGNFNGGSPNTNLRSEKLAPAAAAPSPPPSQIGSLPFSLGEKIKQQNQPAESRDTVYESPDLRKKLPVAASPPERLALEPLPPSAQAPTVGETGQQPASLPDSLESPKPANGDQAPEAVYRVFILKQMGKVIAVFPIHQVQSYSPDRKEKVPKQALAWMEEENQHPVIRFYYKKRLYTTQFQ